MELECMGLIGTELSWRTGKPPVMKVRGRRKKGTATDFRGAGMENKAVRRPEIGGSPAFFARGHFRHGRLVHFRVMVDRPAAMAQAWRTLDRPGDESLPGVNGFEQARSLGQLRRNRRRIGAAGTVSVIRIDARRTKLFETALVVEQVESIAVQMSAFDQDGTGS